MDKQNEANGTASEPIARYDELPILRTYKVALENMVRIGGTWMVGNDGNIYHVEMPSKLDETMWKHAKRYDIQTGEVMGYTNADHIRSMTDEELAVFLAAAAPLLINSFAAVKCAMATQDKATRTWLDWLKEEAKNEL